MRDSGEYNLGFKLGVWGRAIAYGLPITLFLLVLCYYWFAIANRSIIFLYDHLGAGAFEAGTRSRYWMSGLVASGIILALYNSITWFGGRLAGMRYQPYQPPPWAHIWAICALPLALGTFIITTTVNNPTLSTIDASKVTLATLTGLALALMPGTFAAQRPAQLIWLSLVAVGLLPSLLLLRAIELPTLGFATPTTAYPLALGSTLAGLLWASALTWVWAKSYPHPLQSTHLLAATLSLSYLILPLFHHLFLVPPTIRYISTAANFFAFRWEIQLLCLTVMSLSTFGLARLHRHLTKK